MAQGQSTSNISMITWIRTSRFSIQTSRSLFRACLLGGVPVTKAGPGGVLTPTAPSSYCPNPTHTVNPVSREPGERHKPCALRKSFSCTLRCSWRPNTHKPPAENARPLGFGSRVSGFGLGSLEVRDTSLIRNSPPPWDHRSKVGMVGSKGGGGSYERGRTCSAGSQSRRRAEALSSPLSPRARGYNPV